MGSVCKTGICWKKLSFLIIVMTMLSLQACATAQRSQQGISEAYPSNAQFNNRVVEYISDNDGMRGYIDWEKRIIYSVGDGVMPPDAISPAQARVRAKRAAMDEAYGRMVEMTNNVRVDAESTTWNYVNVNRVVHSRISGMVNNAEIVKSVQYEDGSYQVMMKMPMDGSSGFSSALLPVQVKRVRKVRVVSSTSQSVSYSEIKKAENYTGIIIDARGLGAKPAVFPKIMTERGGSVYDVSNANPNATIEEGLVAYRKSIDAAKQVARIGNNPLIITAMKVSGTYKADIVVSDSDAQKIYQADSKGGILGEAKVVVVID